MRCLKHNRPSNECFAVHPHPEDPGGLSFEEVLLVAFAFIGLLWLARFH